MSTRYFKSTAFRGTVWRFHEDGRGEIWTDDTGEWTDSICSISDLRLDDFTTETDADGSPIQPEEQ